MVQGEASPARAWTAAEPLVSRYNEKGRVVGELEVPLVAPGFGLGKRVYVSVFVVLNVMMTCSQRDRGDGVFLVRVRREVDSRSTPRLPSDFDTSVERHPFILVVDKDVDAFSPRLQLRTEASAAGRFSLLA